MAYNYSGHTKEYDVMSNVCDQLKSAVAQYPNKTALVCEAKSITFHELDIESNKIASFLQQKNIGKEHVVAIMSNRGIQYIIAVFGVLKSGAAYLPMSKEYPRSRLNYMCNDSGAALVLSDTDSEAYDVDCITIQSILDSDQHLPYHDIEISPQDLCYVIYTSGTTGKPKGVMIEHHSLFNLVQWHQDYYNVSANDVATLYADISFDASVWELFPYITIGCTMHIIEDSIRLDIIELNSYFEKNGVTHSFLPTQICEEFIKTDNKSLKFLLTGGEALKTYIKRNYTLVNNYGPTENTVVSTCYKVKNNRSNIPIGKPILNCKTYIVGESGKLQKQGTVGELWVGGVGLARGYINNKSLTQEKFITNPFDKSTRVYKTGDLVKVNSDGNMEFYGRVDHQVKLRGYRIETGEIESCIRKLNGITGSLVIAHPNGVHEKSLCAYYTFNKDFAGLDFKNELSKFLPDYMIPEHFIKLRSFPLKPNGKVNLRKLPSPQTKKHSAKSEKKSDIEKTLADIWSNIIDVKNISIHDDFFALGGHSLSATILIQHVYKVFNVKLTINEVFANKKLKDMAFLIKKKDKTQINGIKEAPTKRFYPLSSGQKRMYILSHLDNERITYNVSVVVEFKHLVDEEFVSDCVYKIIDRHDSLRTGFVVHNEEIVQTIYPSVPIKIEQINIPESKLQDTITNFPKPFDLARPPLIRCGLIRVDILKHVLIFDLHHIIADGTSIGIILEEFYDLYQNKDLPQKQYDYKDFVMWQNNLIDSKSIKDQEQYWLNRFKDDVPELKIPCDYNHPETITFQGKRKKFSINAKCSHSITDLLKKENITLFIFMLACYNILLSKYTKQTDIVIGTGTANRQHPDLQRMVGMFVNMLALRNAPSPEKSIRVFLREVKKTALDAFENQDYQFDWLVNKLGLSGSANKNPLFNTLLIVQNINFFDNTIPDIASLQYENATPTSKFDLSMFIVQNKEGGLNCELEYNTSLFNESTIRKMISHFQNIIRYVLDNPDSLIMEVDILFGSNQTDSEDSVYPHTDEIIF